MPKEQDKTTIGLSKSAIATVGVVLAVLAALAFWNDRGGDTATAAATSNEAVRSNTYRNDLQDKKIAENTKDVKDVVSNQHKQEVVQAILLEKATKTESDMSDIKQHLMQYDFGPKKGTD